MLFMSSSRTNLKIRKRMLIALEVLHWVLNGTIRSDFLPRKMREPIIYIGLSAIPL